MGNLNITFEEWRTNLRKGLEAAEQEKQAAALKAKDPADNGELGVPSYNTEAVRSNLNLPKNPTENTVQDKDGTHGLCTVTKPNAVGEGEYPTAIDGDARDAAFKTPSTPLSKIAEDQNASEQLSEGELKSADDQQQTLEQTQQTLEQTQQTAQDADKQAAVKDSFELPAELKSDTSVLQKLAFCGNIILGDERGQRLVTEILTKEAGRIEAQNILDSVQLDLEKQAGQLALRGAKAAESLGPVIKNTAGKGGLLEGILNWVRNNPGKTALGAAGAGAGTAGASYGINSLMNGGDQGAGILGDAGKYADLAGEWLQGSTPIPGLGDVNNGILATAALLAASGAGYGAYKAFGGQEKTAAANQLMDKLAGSAGAAALAALLGGAGGAAGANFINDRLKSAQTTTPAASGDGKGVMDTVSDYMGQAGDWISNKASEAGDYLSGTVDTPVGTVPRWLIAALAGAGGTALGIGGAKAYSALAGNQEDNQDALALMQQENGLEKPASYNLAEVMFKKAHAAWLGALETDIEKAAYMQGATDAAAAAEAALNPEAAAAMGGEIPADDSPITDEEVMGVLQQMVESGEIAPEQLDALMQQVSLDQIPSYSAEQLALMLAEDVQSGAMPQEVAEQIAQEILQGMQDGTIASGAEAAPAADPQAAPTGADQAMEVQASVNRTLDILNNLG